jgi:glutaryl-CoA dehydrogenase
MDLDQFMSAKAVELRKATGSMMDEVNQKFEVHLEETTFPTWIIDKFRELKINGLTMKGFGSPALNSTECGAIAYELAKRDASVTTFFLVHNLVGMAVIDRLGDEE